MDLQDDIHLLERLKTGLKSNVKYAQLAMTLQCMPNVTWDGAVEQLTVHECLTMKESADVKTEKVNMITTKPTAKYNSKPAMRCRRCNKIGHKGIPAKEDSTGNRAIY